MEAVVVIEGVVIVLLVVLVAGLLKSHAEILRELHRLRSGTGTADPSRPPTTGWREAPATELAGLTPDGSTRSLSLANQRSPTLLAFLTSGCASCRVFWQELQGDVEPPVPDTRIVIVTKGEAGESPSRIAELAPPGVPLVMSDEAWDVFKVPLTPYFLLVDEQARVIGEGSASNWDHLVGLLRQSVADTADPARLDTTGRERFTDTRLSESGLEPGDPSLYENPLER